MTIFRDDSFDVGPFFVLEGKKNSMLSHLAVYWRQTNNLFLIIHKDNDNCSSYNLKAVRHAKRGCVKNEMEWKTIYNLKIVMSNRKSLLYLEVCSIPV